MSPNDELPTSKLASTIKISIKKGEGTSENDKIKIIK